MIVLFEVKMSEIEWRRRVAARTACNCHNDANLNSPKLGLFLKQERRHDRQELERVAGKRRPHWTPRVPGNFPQASALVLQSGIRRAQEEAELKRPELKVLSSISKCKTSTPNPLSN
jgi:hypothetical protein